jgi:Mesyanzhinovviridae DNA polymerase
MRRKKSYACPEQGLLWEPLSNWEKPAELPDLRNNIKKIVLDLETKDEGLRANQGPSWYKPAGYICGIAAAWRTEQINSAYFPVRHPNSDCFPTEAVKRWVLDHMKAGIKFIFHNAPYDIGWLNGDPEFQLPVPDKIDDTGCMAYMLDENRLDYTLDALCKWQGLAGKDESILQDAARQYGLDPKADLFMLKACYVGEYAEQDAACTYALAEKFEPQIDEEKVRDAYQLEIDLIPMVHAMRKRGIRIDQNAMQRAYRRFKQQSQDALNELGFKLGRVVSIEDVRSNAWLVKMFNENGLHFNYTKKGAASFEAKWMKDIDHWLPQLLVRAKNREEAAEKFIKNYIGDYLHNGRLHASVNQFRSEQGGGTRTYRFSYSDPPLQQMPHRDEEMAAEVRGCFLPEENEKWCNVDYSQQEYRLFVHYAVMNNLPKSAEAALRYAEDPDTDFHQWVADLTGLPRKPAKDANFAVIYGAGLEKFAFMIKKSLAEAERIMMTYHNEMPFARMLSKDLMTTAQQRGYIRLLDGARIRFKFWTLRYENTFDCSEEEARRRVAEKGNPWFGKPISRSRCHKALNSLIQGGAARQTKLAMRDCFRAGFIPLLQVHDELCFSINSEKQVDQIKDIMCNTIKLRVPMAVDAEIGDYWAPRKEDPE